MIYDLNEEINDMATTITIDPLTRLEGHLAIEVEVDGGVVTDAKSSGTMFRGFEMILRGRDPLDAPHYTQRICGVCPISHGMASCMNLEDAFGVTPPDNGRIMRNLVLGANFVMSHILHFYHLAALDYINLEGTIVKDMAPWDPNYVTDDMVTGSTATTLVNHYVQALAIRRKAHQMAAIFGGKLPCAPSFVPGGCTEAVTSGKISAFRALLNEQLNFIEGKYVPDVLAVAGIFGDYYNIGQGCGNLLAYGVFDLNASGTSKLLQRGRYTEGSYGSVDPALIIEYLKYSKYTGGAKNPADGVTNPNPNKGGAYSWLKAPRYDAIVHETGPLARMWVNDDYRFGISVLDRHAARALEAQKVADAMNEWLNQLVPGAPAYELVDVPRTASGIGLTEAPRGALGHWIDIRSGSIDRYQVVTPTNWNASPMDDLYQPGPIEQALIGTPVADLNQPIEVLRVVHSFDPCLACSVHMLRPGKDKPVAIVKTRPSI